MKDYIEQKIDEWHSRSQTAAPAVSTADELKKLADLRGQGVLSDDEFTDAKRKLLNG